VNSSNNVVTLAGRILMSVVFLVSGVMKLAAYSQVVGYAASKGLPMAGVAIAIAAAVEVLGGLAILAGFQTHVAAWVLFVYLIPVSLAFHNFWAMQGMAQQDNMIHFLKNISIMGGLLVLAANGAGGASVDASRARKS
jgi:putative oxidoreductase